MERRKHVGRVWDMWFSLNQPALQICTLSARHPHFLPRPPQKPKLVHVV